MYQLGYITEIKGNVAEVEVKRVSACGGNCSSCGGSCSAPSMKISIKNTLNAKKGDYVEISVKTNKIIFSAFIVYVIPLINMVIGIIAGTKIFSNISNTNGEMFGFLIGLIFLVLSFFILKRIDNKMKKRNYLTFHMKKIISEH